MAKLSELIKCLEDGGQIRRVTYSNTYLWFTIEDLDDISILTIRQHHNEYEMREAPPKPKEVTFSAWMDEENINSDRCLSGWEVDLSPHQSDSRSTCVEITIKEIL